MANKFDSKYKDMMSHIEVDDEMRTRILKNVEEASKNPLPRAKVTKMPKAQIISMIAAAAVVLVVGGVLLNLANKSSDESESDWAVQGIAPEETAAGISDEAPANNELDFENAESVPGNRGDSDVETAEPEVPEVDAEETEGEESAYVSYKDEDGVYHIVNSIDLVDEFIAYLNLASGDAVDSDRFDMDSGHVYFLINDGNDSYTIRISEKYILIDESECRMILPGHEDLAAELIDFCISNGG